MDSLHLPTGLDRDTVIDNIIMETAELSIVYSRPDVFQKMLDIWSRRKLPVWTSLYNTLLYDYDPISNYDRWEERVHRDDREASRQRKGNFETSGNSQDTGVEKNESTASGTTGSKETEHTHHADTTSGNRKTDTSGDGDTTHNVWGFNVTEPMPAHQDITHTTGTESETTSGTSQGDIDRTLDVGGNSYDNSSSDTNSSNVNTHDERGSDGERHAEQEINFSTDKSHMYGNIGVTTTQQMIQQERDIAQFNIIETIIQDFKKQFCIGIYY